MLYISSDAFKFAGPKNLRKSCRIAWSEMKLGNVTGKEKPCANTLRELDNERMDTRNISAQFTLNVQPQYDKHVPNSSQDKQNYN